MRIEARGAERLVREASVLVLLYKFLRFCSLLSLLRLNFLFSRFLSSSGPPLSVSLTLSRFLPFGVCVARQMSVDLSDKHLWFLQCDFNFMNRGRLWCSPRILFRHWT